MTEVRNRGTSSSGLALSAIAKDDMEDAIVANTDTANYTRSGIIDGYISTARQRTAAQAMVERRMSQVSDNNDGNRGYLSWLFSLITTEPLTNNTDIEARITGDYHVVSRFESKKRPAMTESSSTDGGMAVEGLGEECEPLLPVEESKMVGMRRPESSIGVSGSTGFEGISGSPVLKALYYVVQGMLAGFSFVSLYGREAASNDSDFLISYQTIAADHRRFFYILTTSALVGSLDNALGVLSQMAHKSDRSAAGRRLAINMVPVIALTVFMHVVCFMVNLSMASFDTLVAYKGGESDGSADDDGDDDGENGWTATALKDNTFKAYYEGWKTLERLRLASALIAWVCSCALVWFQFQIVPAMNAAQLETKAQLMKWRAQAQELAGVSGAFDKYTAYADSKVAMAALRRLMDMQSEGLERARTALSALQGNA